MAMADRYTLMTEISRAVSVDALGSLKLMTAKHKIHPYELNHFASREWKCEMRKKCEHEGLDLLNHLDHYRHDRS